jgi:UDP-GlcNAc:undecaprenyl-phosphate GlcNAc-1-phosphate transferase
MFSGFAYYFFSYFTVSMALALLLVPLARSFSFRVGALDKGEGRRIHTGVIPRLGGIALFLAFCIPTGFSLTRGTWDNIHDSMVGILVASTLVFLVGMYDDIKGATIRNKLIAEILAASIVYFWGIRIESISSPLGGTFVLGWLSFPATILWIIVITNAVNLIDGLDGLAAGTGILISITLFSLSGSDLHLQLTYVILAGSLVGFLRYNFPPATIFMGDSGSLFTGFILAAMSILSSNKATAFVTVMIPVLAFSFPLLDMIYAVLRRYYRGLPLGEPDKEHIHHKLLEKGLTKKKVVILLYSFNVFIVLLSLTIITKHFNVHYFGLLLIVVCAVLGLRLLGYIEFIPYAKEIARNFSIGRKTKYFNYVIKRFRHDVSACSLDDFFQRVTELLKEYHFSSAKIFVNVSGVEKLAYALDNGDEDGSLIAVSFPIVGSDGRHLGKILITKQMHDEYFLCANEIIMALSEEMASFIEKNQGSFRDL